jgi:hypothetical protein
MKERKTSPEKDKKKKSSQLKNLKKEIHHNKMKN